MIIAIKGERNITRFFIKAFLKGDKGLSGRSVFPFDLIPTRESPKLSQSTEFIKNMWLFVNCERNLSSINLEFPTITTLPLPKERETARGKLFLIFGMNLCSGLRSKYASCDHEDLLEEIRTSAFPFKIEDAQGKTRLPIVIAGIKKRKNQGISSKNSLIDASFIKKNGFIKSQPEIRVKRKRTIYPWLVLR